MARAIIIYESNYGNTRLVAEKIVEGLKEIPGIEPALQELKEVDRTRLAGYDAILIGSPNHIGRATGGISKFITGLGKLNLTGKAAAVFDTYLGRDFEKAVKKMEKQLTGKAPGLKLIAPGLSVRVDGMKGPISDGELPRCQEFGVTIANLIKN
ncbi:flavodoxin family protein [Chloroflexota bacterium]